MSKVYENPHLNADKKKDAAVEGDYGFDDEYQVGDSDVEDSKKTDEKTDGKNPNPAGEVKGKTINPLSGGVANTTISRSMDVPPLAMNWSPEVNAYIQNLIKQGLSDAEIANKTQLQFGITISLPDIEFAKGGAQQGNGLLSKTIINNGNYPQYTPITEKSNGQGISYNYSQQQQFFLKMLQDQQNAQQTQGQIQKSKKESQQVDVKMNMIMFMIATGNLTGALRAMWTVMDMETRMQNKVIVNQLRAVTNAKNQTLAALNNHIIPRSPTATMTEQQAADISMQQSKYQLFVQTTQGMLGDLGQTRMQLTDDLASSKSQLDNFIQLYNKVAEEEQRTTEQLLH